MAVKSDPTQVGVLLCPACRFDYTHIGAVIHSSDARTDIHGSCENGHPFTVSFVQHKGQTFVESAQASA